MKAKNAQRKRIRTHLEKYLPSKEAKLSENLWRINYATMKEFYPKLVESVPKEVLMCFMEDCIYADRIWRKMRVGTQNELKKIMGQNYVLNELGAEVGSVQLAKEIRNEIQ